jgi:hypothetical protein
VIAFTLLFGLATAAEPLWAGVPLASLEGLGIGAPTVSHLDSSWRAPLSGGGIVDVTWYPTVGAAQEAALVRGTQSAQRPLPELAPNRWGQEGEILLVRDQNVLMFVRSLDGTADVAMTALQGALVVEPSGDDWQEMRIDGQLVAWDACGRRRVAGD